MFFTGKRREDDWVTPIIEKIQAWPASAHISMAVLFVGGFYYYHFFQEGDNLGIKTLCFLGGFIFMWFCVVQFWKEWRYMRAVERFVKGKADHCLAEMELLVKGIYHLQGYEVRHSDPALSSREVDIVASSRKVTYFIQFNHWNEPTLRIQTVQALHRTALAYHAAAVLVAFGEINEETRNFARLKEVTIFDREHLLVFIHEKLYNAKPRGKKSV